MTTTIDLQLLGPVPLAAAGSSAGDAIGQALDRARTSQEIDDIVTFEVPFSLTIEKFDRVGLTRCTKGPREGVDHVDEDGETFTISTESEVQLVDQVTEAVSAMLTSEVQRSVKSTLGGQGASSEVAGSVRISATKTVADTFARTLTRRLKTSETRSRKSQVIAHASGPCRQRETEFGFLARVTALGTAVLKQDFTVTKGRDGLFGHRVESTARLLELRAADDDIDGSISLQNRIGKETAIRGCTPQRADGATPSLPVVPPVEAPRERETQEAGSSPMRIRLSGRADEELPPGREEAAASLRASIFKISAARFGEDSVKRLGDLEGVRSVARLSDIVRAAAAVRDVGELIAAMG